MTSNPPALSKMVFCTAGLRKIPQVPALLENGQLVRGKGGLEPGQVLVRQEKIVLIDDERMLGLACRPAA